MKIIFLDIDGVLNSLRYDTQRGKDEGNIDVSRLPLLKQLVDQTGAKIVLTSSWRSHWDPLGKGTDRIGKDMENTFADYGLALYDKTPEVHNDRPKEIDRWLDGHPNVSAYVILDDIKFGWGKHGSYVVQTDCRIGRGLEPPHIEKAIRILSKA